ncbi:MAG: hypothetical protein Q4E22_00205 [Coriobacteriia bacterium]|nr:hypothetical protein [Coriobacteriia bacterium]
MENASQKEVSVKRVIQFAGAMVGTLIGSGFASGQEVMQFFTNYGINGIVGAIITMLGFAFLGAVLMSYGYHNRNADKLRPYHFFTNKYIGAFLEWFTILFCFLIGVIMISGAGATFSQYFNVPAPVGSTLMMLLGMLTALLGLKKIVAFLGSIGPVAIAFLIIIALVGIFQTAGNLPLVNEQVAQAGDKVVRGIGDSNSWWFAAAIMYVAYNIIAGVPFVSLMGTEAASKKEAIAGGLLGGAILGACALVLNVAMLGVYPEAVAVEVPTLIFATNIHPLVGVIFAIVLLIMIYNTIVPMIVSVANQFAKPHEKPKLNRILLVAIPIVMLFFGQLPFGMLVNVIYPFVGYFGLAFIFVVLIRLLVWKVQGKDGYQEEL